MRVHTLSYCAIYVSLFAFLSPVASAQNPAPQSAAAANSSQEAPSTRSDVAEFQKLEPSLKFAFIITLAITITVGIDAANYVEIGGIELMDLKLAARTGISARSVSGCSKRGSPLTRSFSSGIPLTFFMVKSQPENEIVGTFPGCCRIFQSSAEYAAMSHRASISSCRS